MFVLSSLRAAKALDETVCSPNEPVPKQGPRRLNSIVTSQLHYRYTVTRAHSAIFAVLVL